MASITQQPRTRPIVSPRAPTTTTVSPRLVREDRAKTTTTRPSIRSSSVVEKTSVEASPLHVSPNTLALYEKGSLPFIDYWIHSKNKVNSISTDTDEMRDALFGGNKKAQRAQYDGERSSDVPSQSIYDKVPKVNKGKAPLRSEAELGFIMPDEIFTRYLKWFSDQGVTSGLTFTQEAKDLLKLAVESYTSAFIESGKMVALAKGKMTLSGDDLTLVSQLPVAKHC